MQFLTGLSLRQISPHPDTLVDLGAGTGSSLELALQFVNPDVCTAVDASKPMLNLLREKFKEDPRVRVKHMAAADFLAEATAADTKFRVAQCISCLYVMPPEDQRAIISAVPAILPAGGYFIFDYDPFIPGDPTHGQRECTYYGFGTSATEYRRTPAEVRADVAASGLEVVHDELVPSRPETNPGLLVGFMAVRKAA